MEKRIAIRQKLDLSSYLTFMRRKNLTLALLRNCTQKVNWISHLFSRNTEPPNVSI